MCAHNRRYSEGLSHASHSHPPTLLLKYSLNISSFHAIFMATRDARVLWDSLYLFPIFPIYKSKVLLKKFALIHFTFNVFLMDYVGYISRDLVSTFNVK